MKIKQLEKGVRYNELGAFYDEIDEINEVRGRVAWATCHHENGYTFYGLFLMDKNGNWESRISSEDKDALEEEFEGWCKFVESPDYTD